MSQSESNLIEAFAYVPTSQLPSIQKHGYLSIYQQVQLLGDEARQRIIDKYISRVEADNAFELSFKMMRGQEAWSQLTPIDKIVLHMEWRSPGVSNQIPFVFKPISQKVLTDHRFIAQRGAYMSNKSLISFHVNRDNIQWANHKAKHLSNNFYRPQRYWDSLWFRALKESEKFSHVDWFAGVMFGLVATTTGIIPSRDICVVRESKTDDQQNEYTPINDLVFPKFERPANLRPLFKIRPARSTNPAPLFTTKQKVATPETAIHPVFKRVRLVGAGTVRPRVTFQPEQVKPESPEVSDSEPETDVLSLPELPELPKPPSPFDSPTADADDVIVLYSADMRQTLKRTVSEMEEADKLLQELQHSYHVAHELIRGGEPSNDPTLRQSLDAFSLDTEPDDDDDD